MTSMGAFGRLVTPSLLLFCGLLIFRDWHSEPALVGVVVCAASLAWLIVATVQVAKSLPVVPAAPTRRGYTVLPVRDDAGPAAG